MARTKKHSEPVKRWSSPNAEYTNKEVQRIRDAAESISEAFNWEDAKEGSDHWLVVYERLHEIANEIEERINSGFDVRV